MGNHLIHIFLMAIAKAGRELQTEHNTRIMEGEMMDPQQAGAGHRAVNLHRGCVLVSSTFLLFISLQEDQAEDKNV